MKIPLNKFYAILLAGTMFVIILISIIVSLFFSGCNNNSSPAPDCSQYIQENDSLRQLLSGRDVTIEQLNNGIRFKDSVIEKTSAEFLFEKLRADSLQKFILTHPVLVYDTSFVLDTIPFYDTSFVLDTIPFYDTSKVIVFDTIPYDVPVFDTTYRTINLDESSIENLLSWGVTDTTDLEWNIRHYKGDSLIFNRDSSFTVPANTIAWDFTWYFRKVKAADNFIDSAFFMQHADEHIKTIFPGPMFDNNTLTGDTVTEGTYMKIFFDSTYFIKEVQFVTNADVPIGWWSDGFRGEIQTGQTKTLPINTAVNYLNISFTGVKLPYTKGQKWLLNEIKIIK